MSIVATLYERGSLDVNAYRTRQRARRIECIRRRARGWRSPLSIDVTVVETLLRATAANGPVSVSPSCPPF